MITTLIALCLLLLTLCLLGQTFALYALWRLWQRQPVLPEVFTDFARAPWRDTTHYA